MRVFDPEEDITYLAAFGNSVIAELARLDAIAANSAKTTFISSMSHELRSPLHGILAGVEFLQESELTAFQQEMTTTISMAGTTLLDTIDHILDYSKINNFTGAQKKERVRADSARHESSSGPGDNNEIGVTTNVDFAKLTEDVVETVVAASRYQAMATSVEKMEQRDQAPQSAIRRRRSMLSDKLNSVSMIVDIPWRHRWWIVMQPGSWTRILTNLLGNALKYTIQGSISVKLQVGEPLKPSEDFKLIPITLTIQDTGIGISKQFMERDLYTPFKQENSHSSGAGLGLSIVRQIVREIGANINFSSEAGKGTKVVVKFNGKFVTKSLAPGRSITTTPCSTTLRTFGNKRVHMLIPKDDASRQVTADTVRLRSSLTDLCTNWLGANFSSGPSMADHVAVDICLITEADLPIDLAGSRELHENFYSCLNSDRRPPLIVFGSSIQSDGGDIMVRDTTLNVSFISQP